MEYSNIINKYRIGTSPGSANITESQIISENLFSTLKEGISSMNGVKITKIRIVPYEFYSSNKGSFKLYSLSVDLYDKYKDNKEYVNISNAEDKTRHNIVDNMVRIKTIKWDTSRNT